jgi:hypothetical protein
MSLIATVILAAAPVQSTDIVVTGRAQTPEEERKEVRDYVRKLGVAKGETQAARWTERVCPKVYGAKPDIARVVTDRIRSLASETGIGTAKAKCKVNIAVVFVDDGAAFAKAMHKKSFRHFSDMTFRDREELFKSDAPVRWWYTIEAGPAANSSTAVFNSSLSDLGQSISAGRNGPSNSLSTVTTGLIGSGTARSIRIATVAVDVNRSEGTPLNAVADYVAFVSLMAVDPPKVAPPQSVLGLFAGASDGLTQRDRDFLKGAYKIALNREAYIQRARLTGQVLRAAKARDMEAASDEQQITN